jgi:hypothetical protein
MLSACGSDFDLDEIAAPREQGVLMWTTARRVMVSVGAVLAVSVPIVQLRKECQDATFFECVGGTAKWALGIDQASPARPGPPPTPVNATPVNTPPPPSKSANVVASTPARGFMVINAGSDAVLAFYASRCEDRNWGNDRLGSNELIGPGQRRTINLSDGAGTCCFDLRARFRNGTKRDMMNVDVCRLTHWTVAN